MYGGYLLKCISPQGLYNPIQYCRTMRVLCSDSARYLVIATLPSFYTVSLTSSSTRSATAFHRILSPIARSSSQGRSSIAYRASAPFSALSDALARPFSPCPATDQPDQSARILGVRLRWPQLFHFARVWLESVTFAL